MIVQNSAARPCGQKPPFELCPQRSLSHNLPAASEILDSNPLQESVPAWAESEWTTGVHREPRQSSTLPGLGSIGSCPSPTGPGAEWSGRSRSGVRDQLRTGCRHRRRAVPRAVCISGENYGRLVPLIESSRVGTRARGCGRLPGPSFSRGVASSLRALLRILWPDYPNARHISAGFHFIDNGSPIILSASFHDTDCIRTHHWTTVRGPLALFQPRR